jgi:hypothetical protein
VNPVHAPGIPCATTIGSTDAATLPRALRVCDKRADRSLRPGLLGLDEQTMVRDKYLTALLTTAAVNAWR